MPDFHDTVLDARSELAGADIYLSTPEIVRMTLDVEQSHDVYRLVPALGRHPFGLPIVAAPSGDVPTPTGAATAPSLPVAAPNGPQIVSGPSACNAGAARAHEGVTP